MQLDETPVYRKPVVPWHDTNLFCGVLIFFWIMALWFGFTGLSVGAHSGVPLADLWIPSLVIALSGGGLIRTILRLVRRSGIVQHRSY